jgi:hypothetical protein
MTGNLGVLSMYVNRLNNADERNQSDTQQRQEHHILGSARFAFKSNQRMHRFGRNSAYTSQLNGAMR